MNKGLFLIGAFGFAVLSACRHSASNAHDDDAQTEKHSKQDSHSEKDHGPGIIVLLSDNAKAAGIQVETVKPGEFHGVTITGGKILTAANDENTIVATVAGIVSVNRPITEGMSVDKGMAVFTISSSELQDGDLVQRALITYRTAKAEYERAKELIADRIITETDFLAAKAEYDNALLAYKAIVQNGTSKGVVVKPTNGGYVKECMVRDGDYVNVGQPLMTVTRNRRLYLRAEVAERDYAILNKITSAKFKMSYSDKVYDLNELDGHLLSYGKTAGNTSTFIPVTFELDTRSGIIPGAFAEIYLLTGSRSNVISIPTTALTEEQGVYFVYIQEDKDCYRKQEVRLGQSDGTRTEIVSGLKGGEKLVTVGAIHVKMASAGNIIPGHNHNH